MTQPDFDRLPLLLRYWQVVMVLDGLNKRALIESIADGTLRHWPLTPAPRHRRYYLKRDVARMAGLKLNMPQLPRLNQWMHRADLLALLGMGRQLFWTQCRAGGLDCEHERQQPWRLRLRTAPEFLPNEVSHEDKPSGEVERKGNRSASNRAERSSSLGGGRPDARGSKPSGRYA